MSPCLFVGDVYECLSLNPFFEVVGHDEDESPLPRAWHWSDYVHSPSHDRIRGSRGLQQLSWTVDVWRMSLTFIGQCSTTREISRCALLYFGHDQPGFSAVAALKEDFS